MHAASMALPWRRSQGVEKVFSTTWLRTDGVLINVLPGIVWVHDWVLLCDRHITPLNLKILTELLPAHLSIHAYQVRVLARQSFQAQE